MTLAPFVDSGIEQDPACQPADDGSEPGQRSEQPVPAGRFRRPGADRAGDAKIRASTGIELQVMLPVVNAPFRLYWAYNPSIVREYLQPPIVADRSAFPNQQHIPQFRRAVWPAATRSSKSGRCSDSQLAGRSNWSRRRQYGSIFTLRSFQLEEEFCRFPRFGSGHGRVGACPDARPKWPSSTCRTPFCRPRTGRRPPASCRPSSRPRRPSSKRSRPISRPCRSS